MKKRLAKAGSDRSVTLGDLRANARYSYDCEPDPLFWSFYWTLNEATALVIASRSGNALIPSKFIRSYCMIEVGLDRFDAATKAAHLSASWPRSRMTFGHIAGASAADAGMKFARNLCLLAAEACPGVASLELLQREQHRIEPELPKGMAWTPPDSLGIVPMSKASQQWVMIAAKSINDGVLPKERWPDIEVGRDLEMLLGTFHDECPAEQPSMDDEHVQILEVHADRPNRRLKQLDLYQATRIAEKTIRARLQDLIRWGYLARPHGEKGGTAITEAGKQALMIAG